MSRENVKIVRAAIDAFNRRDLKAWDALSHPDVEVDWSGSRGLEAGVYRGREETNRFVRTFETFERVVTEPERFIESGDSVVVPNSARFRGRDGIETVARTTVVYELLGGRVARVCLYQDTADALEAAGIEEEGCPRRAWRSAPIPTVAWAGAKVLPRARSPNGGRERSGGRGSGKYACRRQLRWS
jgi:ketosteroid isomerase-like protein